LPEFRCLSPCLPPRYSSNCPFTQWVTIALPATALRCMG
jgi:hypothetical protein